MLKEKLSKEQDQDYLQMAFELAQQGYGAVSPNPYVGAILVKDGEIIGRGYHQCAGEAHAEVNAVKDAKAQGHDVFGATLYVTLEPCCFTGKTPACTDLILQNGIARVVTAMEDPNPKVAGQGHQILRNAGIEVETNLAVDQGQALLEIFICNQLQKRTFVTLKAALSLDGKLATQAGDSQWITGSEARKKAHYYRGLHDAILIGKGTLIADNPSLTVRYGFETKAPIRILLLNNFAGITSEMIRTYPFFDTGLAPSWICFDQHYPPESELQTLLRAQGIKLISLTDTQPQTLLAALYAQGVMSLFIEGGAQIYDAFISANCVDEYLLFYGPSLIGNPNAFELWRNSPITELEKAPRLEITETCRCGESVLMIAKNQGPNNCTNIVTKES